MSTTRLTFLYPHLFRTLRLTEASTQSTRACRRQAADARGHGQYAAFSTTPASRQPPIVGRHGKAVEPVPLGDESISKPPQLSSSAETPPSTGNPDQGRAQTTEGPEPKQTTDAPQGAGSGGSRSSKSSTSTPESVDKGKKAASEARDEVRAEAKKSGPLEAMLHSKSEEGNNTPKHPHLSPPPYVHHFDSYSLVKQLEIGGYTREQSITAMKAIRGLLAQNLDVAQDSLVSKSDVENETYLFRAACSELSTEVKNNRRIADEEMRRQRTLLQHEVDILTQSMNQELLTLNDNVRGMFNDRRIAVREEQKAVESTIQQISYKISISLSSDAKSEIEGLRWVLIRRSVIGILFMAVLTLGALRYGTYLSQEQKKEAERLRKQAELLKAADARRDHASAPDAAEILAAS
ncbi:hypothetical protein SODALDRAFT_311339 [Sodiomyces alkalinus F11]|uniref:MOZ protein represents a chromatin-associated acetyltransferase n=1 Tax=Sodiomyces alkalinus (strain CBS 110278 / VKM F-3762 / F11) TaxID=1314773 RepID=A0A3N2PVJ8_SODAK|nr:hypothetical protein SODALDRAFT_311339 [Sodiomyces alkalinus F11]ROT38525.1 hypothetical protein SODALDRAFT_311339 [Sodiomyces alkalinus F11]